MKNYFFKVKQKRIPRGERVYEKLCFQIKQKIKSAGGRGGVAGLCQLFFERQMKFARRRGVASLLNLEKIEVGANLKLSNILKP